MVYEVRDMRCGCPQCEEYMVHRESGMDMECICPNCGFTCHACKGPGNQIKRNEPVPLEKLLEYDLFEEYYEKNKSDAHLHGCSAELSCAENAI